MCGWPMRVLGDRVRCDVLGARFGSRLSKGDADGGVFPTEIRSREFGHPSNLTCLRSPRDETSVHREQELLLVPPAVDLEERACRCGPRQRRDGSTSCRVRDSQRVASAHGLIVRIANTISRPPGTEVAPALSGTRGQFSDFRAARIAHAVNLAVPRDGDKVSVALEAQSESRGGRVRCIGGLDVYYFVANLPRISDEAIASRIPADAPDPPRCLRGRTPSVQTSGSAR